MTPPPFDPGTGPGRDLRRPPSSPFARVRRAPWRPFGTRLSAVVAVSAGGVLGGCARYGINQLVPTDAGAFPWATFLVNVSGSFCLALLLVLILDVWPPMRFLRPFLAVGVLGSFTTLSTWMVELDQLLIDGATTLAAAYLAASVFAGVAATCLGLLLGRAVAARRTRTSTKDR